jgi:hypothetical protein
VHVRVCRVCRVCCVCLLCCVSCRVSCVVCRVVLCAVVRKRADVALHALIHEQSLATAWRYLVYHAKHSPAKKERVAMLKLYVEAIVAQRSKGTVTCYDHCRFLSYTTHTT